VRPSFRAYHEGKAGEAIPQVAIRGDENVSDSFGDSDVDQVKERMLIEAAGELPGSVHIARLVDDTNGKPANFCECRIGLGTAPPLAPDPGDQGVADLLEE